MNVWAWPAFAYFTDYLPLNTQALARRFPLRSHPPLQPGSALQKLMLGQNLLTGSLENETFLLKGRDRNQKPFSIALAPRTYTVFTGDLDANGTADLMLVFDTGGNGLAPSQHLLTYLVDAQGRPFPFAVEGYFTADAQGLPDLLDLNQDGKAELVYMQHQKGYWITQLYTAHQGRWQQVSGAFAGKTYPLYSRFTQGPNRVAVPPPKPTPFLPLLGNQTAFVAGQLKSFRWAAVSQSENISLNVMAQGKLLSCQPDSWNSTFTTVIDDVQGRQIASFDDPARVQAQLERLMGMPHQLKLFGKRSPTGCSPELLWAHP